MLFTLFVYIANKSFSEHLIQRLLSRVMSL